LIRGLRDDLALPIQTVRRPSRAPAYIRVVDAISFDDESRINGEVDGVSAVRNAIWHIVNTERYSWIGCLSNEGIELEQFIGKSFGYFQTKVESVFQDALLQDNRILRVILVRTWQPQFGMAAVEFEVQSIYGTFAEEFEIPLAQNRAQINF